MQAMRYPRKHPIAARPKPSNLRNLVWSITFLLPNIAAAADNLMVYGLASTAVESLQAKDATKPTENIGRTTRLSNYASFIGFRGSEDIGGGMHAFFQLEGDVGIDNGAGAGLTSKYTQVGLDGDWGRMSLGRYDTPYLFVGLFLNPSFVGIGSQYSILGAGNRTGRANVSADRSSFERRQDNSVQYWTPVFNGIQGKLMWGIGEEKTASVSPSMWSASVDYNNGPFYAAYGRESLLNYATGGDSRDHGDKIAAAYTFSSRTKVGGVFERIIWKNGIMPDLAKGNAVGAANSSSRDSYFLYLQQKFGSHLLGAAYGTDRGVKLDTGTVPSSRSHQWTLHYEYALSKRTSIFAVATKLTNQAASNNVLYGRLSGFNSAAGADPQGLAIGLRHFF